MSFDDDPEAYGYVLEMPFVIVKSRGGPYDDESFAAGMSCGETDAELAQAASIGALALNRTVRRSCLPQLELIAMKHGYNLGTGDEIDEPSDDPDWVEAYFTADNSESPHEADD